MKQLNCTYVYRCKCLFSVLSHDSCDRIIELKEGGGKKEREKERAMKKEPSVVRCSGD